MFSLDVLPECLTWMFLLWAPHGCFYVLSGCFYWMSYLGVLTGVLPGVLTGVLPGVLTGCLT